MSCCPGIRCKNTGSGYVKPEGGEAGALEKRVSEMLAARTAQDERIFPSLKNTTTYVPNNLNVGDTKTNKKTYEVFQS